MLLTIILAGAIAIVPPYISPASVPPAPPWREQEREEPPSPAHLTGNEGSGLIVLQISRDGDSTMEPPTHHQNNGNPLKFLPSPAGGNN